MISEARVLEHRARALSPDHPVIRGTAQNPDVHFQARETVNPFYAACPGIVQKAMDDFAELTGRRYDAFEYHGAPDAERVIVLMGSGCEAAHETVDFLQARKEKVGLLKVRLYRPFDARRFVEALPKTAGAIAVLDRTKEPGSGGEPLYLDCVNALYEQGREKVRAIGGRYGLSSKEFTPAMVKAVFEHLAPPVPKNHFTIGIDDDLSHTSLDFEPSFSIEPDDVVRAQFFGLGHRKLRRGAELFSRAAQLQGRSRGVCRAHCEGESGHQHSHHREPERLNFWRLADLRAANRASRRRRPGAEHLLAAD